MRRDQIAVQLYTLRDHLESRDSLVDTCRNVAAIGYRAVQVAAVDFAVVAPEEVRAICADHGLVICSAHDATGRILEDAEPMRRILDVLGVRHVSYPYPAGVDLGDEAAVDAMIRALDATGSALAADGITLAYHHHHLEFRHLGGRTIIGRIFERIPPERLDAELDSYWVQNGGGDPVAWCHAMAGRLTTIHLKDYVVNDRNQPTFAEVGHGNLDMPAIVRAAEASGCEWFIVEQDVCPGDPFDSIRMSFEHLAGIASD